MTARRRPSSPSVRAQRRDLNVARALRPVFVCSGRPFRSQPAPQCAWEGSSLTMAMTMDSRILAAIRKIPRGKVSTYGAIARAAGYPGAARQVVGILRRAFDLPWQRVLGAGGEIKLRGDSAIEQRLRLEGEGVVFRGRRVDMKRHEFKFHRLKTKAKPKKRRIDRPPGGKRRTTNG
jgi:methylated-DNA-protein-cysteine methyltransferase-like protein